MLFISLSLVCIYLFQETTFAMDSLMRSVQVNQYSGPQDK